MDQEGREAEKGDRQRWKREGGSQGWETGRGFLGEGAEEATERGRASKRQKSREGRANEGRNEKENQRLRKRETTHTGRGGGVREIETGRR